MTERSQSRNELLDTLDALYRETTPGEWETRFYTGDTGKTIVTPAGSLIPMQNCLSSADLCFIVEMRRHWPDISRALRSETAATAPKWVSPTNRQPDVDGRLWAVLTERRENGKRTGFVPTFEYYHFINGWATDDTILFWLDSPLHPLPSVRTETGGKGA